MAKRTQWKIRARRRTCSDIFFGATDINIYECKRVPTKKRTKTILVMDVWNLLFRRIYRCSNPTCGIETVIDLIVNYN